MEKIKYSIIVPIYNNEKSIPGFNLNLLIENGMIQYPGLPRAINNMQVNTKITCPGVDANKTVINVSKLHVDLGQFPIDAHMLVKTPITDPDIDGHVKGNLDLATMKDLLPLEKGTSLAGKIAADITFKGKMSAIETSIIGFKGKLYNVKFFSSSKMTFQLAGSIEPDFSDAIDVFSKLVDYFNMFCLNGEYQPISLGDINSKMMNFKFIIKLEKDTLLDMKIFSDMLTLDEKVSDICSPNEENMLAVRHIISFKFNNSLVKMFPSSGIIKINILGTSSHNCANEIYSFICDIVKNGYDTITYKRPLTDEELLQNSIVN
jgi:hypothetical protein